MQDFQRFEQDLGSPYWWFTAVVLAIGVNLISSYVKPVMDRWLAVRSKRRTAAIQREAQETHLWAKFLLQDSRLLHLTETQLITLRIKMLSLGIAVLAESAALSIFWELILAVVSWPFLIAAAASVAVQLLVLFWSVTDAFAVARRLEYVQALLQERILNPFQAAVEPADAEA